MAVGLRRISSPFTFAESWYQFLDGAHGDVADATAVKAAQRSLEEDLDDDGEIESRAHHAAKTVGAWLKPLLPELTDEVAAINHALDSLGLIRADSALRVPIADSRFDRLLEVVTQHLRDGKQWKEDERLIIFTEYKTTLDYLFRRFKDEFKSDYQSRIRVLFGGKSQAGLMNRDEVIAAFNDPDDPIRILIATDVASEGLNLQESARLVFHFDIPWNPSRLEQRNGRLDRHGQARDVTVFHFTSEDDADLKFVGKVVQKVHEIREDLGSMGQVFDAAFERRFQDQEDTDPLIEHLEHDVKKAKGRAIVPRDAHENNGEEYAKQLVEFGHHIDLTPETLKQTLEVALASGFGYPRLDGPDAKGRMRLSTPIPPRWQSLIDDTLRLERKGAAIGALPAIVFDPRFFLDESKGRAVFRPKPDTVLLHLGHPVFHYALSTLAPHTRGVDAHRGDDLRIGNERGLPCAESGSGPFLQCQFHGHAHDIDRELDLILRHHTLVAQNDRHSAEIKGNCEADVVSVHLPVGNLDVAPVGSRGRAVQRLTVRFERERNRNVTHRSRHGAGPFPIDVRCENRTRQKQCNYQQFHLMFSLSVSLCLVSGRARRYRARN